MNRQVRIGQLIAPFGPGAIYTDRKGTPLVVCGIDHWFKCMDVLKGLVQCQNPAEFQIFEPRLATLLGVDRFCRPVDFRFVRKGQQPPPNAMVYTPAQRFPRWYRNSKTGQMKKFSLATERLDRPSEGRWLPVRFVAVCGGGHLSEFPWKQWIGCQCSGDGDLYLTDRGGSELSSIRVECHSCPTGSPGHRGRNLSGTTIKPNLEQSEQSAFQQAGIGCPGERPWLGEGASENGCNHPLIGALINQINLYFPKTVSAILLPDIQQQDSDVIQLRNEIELDAATCGVSRTLWNMNLRAQAIGAVIGSLKLRGINAKEDQIEKALESLFTTSMSAIPEAVLPAIPESDMLSFRRAEFDIIRNKVSDSKNIPNLRTIPTSVPTDLTTWITKVNLVERLRETRVFYGFDRLESNPQPLVGMPDSAMKQLFLNPPQQRQDRWLPAVEVFGEGIYIEFSEKKISDWQNQNEDWLAKRINDGFITRLAGVFQTLPPNTAADRKWATKYLLIHSLAHILINQLVFECGYSSASLRERLYISVDAKAPMAGFLIYTAAGDSEGTLGGLVRLGQPDRLNPIFLRAISRASWCSADPVCSENLGGQGSRLVNLAACHACILLPETSCETVNHGLDRAMVVGTPDNRQSGFMVDLLNQVYTLGY
jgi:hypothetical protein